MEDYIIFVENNKDSIVQELYNWAETFDWERDEDREKTDEPYDKIYSLAKRLQNDNCTIEDYNNIEYHIFQINYNEIIIDMGFPSGVII